MEASRRWLAALLAVLAIVGITVFGRALFFGFVQWDDPSLIVDNAIVHSITPETIKDAFTSYDPELYIPLTLLSYQIDYAIGDGSPFLFHLTNIILHILNAILVAVLAILLTRKFWMAAILALAFLVHPIQVEAVAWASARKDLLSTFFFLLSCITYIRYSSGSKRSYVASLIFFLLALLSKVTVLVLPLLLFLFDAGERVSWKPFAWRPKMPYFVFSIIFGVIAVFGKGDIPVSMSLIDRAIFIPKSILFLLWKIILPTNLSVVYPYTDPIQVTSPDLLLCALGLLLLTAIMYWVGKSVREVWLGYLFFLIALVPSFITFNKGEGMLDIYITSDRYAYIPLIGILLVTCYGLLAFTRKYLPDFADRLLLGCAVLVLASFVISSFVQTGVWRDTDSLFSHAVAKYPNSQVAHTLLGSLKYERGNVQEAIDAFERSIAIRPTARAYYNLGTVMLDAERLDDALLLYATALQLDSKSHAIQMNIGVTYVKKKMYPEAADAFRKTILLKPDLVMAHVNLGIVQQEMGDVDAAREAYRTALSIEPNHPIALQQLSTLDL